MRVLVLGGSQFVGRHVVQIALDRGHDVTTFNRGKTNPGLFPDVEELHGDRDGDLGALESGEWDVLIDVSGYIPRHVRESSELLADRVGHGVFVSTISVYHEPHDHGLDEDAPLAQLDDPSVEEVGGGTYGGLKVLCEQAFRDAFDGRAAVVRPGLIVGPHDHTGRFTYWPERLARGGEVLGPGAPTRRVQFIDVRDLAAFLLHCGEAAVTGTFNGTGPAADLTFGAFLTAAGAALDATMTVTWVDDDVLLSEGVAPFTGVPLWLPATAPTGMLAVSVKRALDHGLVIRPLADSLRDTLAWVQGAREDGSYTTPADVGLTPQREADLLASARAGR